MSGAEIYIYYRIEAADEAAVQQRVEAFQRALRQEYPGLQTRLLRRLENSTAQVTLMETYAFLANGDTPVATTGLLASIERAAAAIAPFLQAARHAEVFEPCA